MTTESGKRSSYRKRIDFRLDLLILVLAGVVVSLAAPFWSLPTAHAATCPSSQNGHYYAAVCWDGTNIGNTSTLKTVGLFSVNDGVNHISEEIWVVDLVNSCAFTGASWLEAGEATQKGQTGNWYFWGECPRGGSQDLYHWEYQPPGGDVGQYFQYFVSKPSTTTTTWSITMDDNVGNFKWGANTTNTMSPNRIITGLETTSQSYSITHSDPDYFINNKFKDANSGAWTAQTIDGLVASANPPSWTWVTHPAPGNNGGQGKTTCC